MLLIANVISYLTTGFVATAFYIKPYKWYYRLLIGVVLTILCFLYGNTLGQFITPIALGFGIIITFFTTKDRLWNVILFQLGWFWFVVTDYIISVPSWLSGITVVAIQNNGNLCMIYSLLHTLTGLIPATIIAKHLRKSIYPKLMKLPLKAQVLLCVDVSICCCIYIFNIIYGSFNHYEQGALLFNGLIFTFYLICNLLIFYFLYHIMRENMQLAIESKSKEELLSYTENLETLYENMRVFRHDYINILSTMKYYIDEGNVEVLKKYFTEKILPYSSSITSQNIFIGKLSYIKILEIKSIVYTKLIKAIQADLNISIELMDEINNVYMDTLKLCNILGILLDNAIEAASHSDEKNFKLAIINSNDTLLIHIENSTLPISVPIERLFEEGYSSKNNEHFGIGLSQVNQIINDLPNVFISTTYSDLNFTQLLEIEKNPIR